MNNMNRRNFIKTLGLATTGLLFPFNTLSNNIDPELLEIYNFTKNYIKKLNKQVFGWDNNILFIESLIHHLDNTSENEPVYLNKPYIDGKYIEGMTYTKFGYYNFDGYMLINNPFIYSLIKKYCCGDKNYNIIKDNFESNKYDQIFIGFNHNYEIIKTEQIENDTLHYVKEHIKIDFGRFNIKNEKDYFSMMNIICNGDIRKTEFYKPILTYKLN